MPALLNNIKEALQGDLPAMRAHKLMMPETRRLPEPLIPFDSPARQSAVLLLLYPKQEELYTCFIRRAQDGRVHGGQIAFPGGKTESQDKSVVETALRETHEEIGIDAHEIDVLGQLTEIYIPASNYCVYPVVAYTSKQLIFEPDPTEVDEVIESPLNCFLLPKSRRIANIPLHGFNVRAPYYQLNKADKLWGATAMIMAEFLEIYRPFV